MKKTIQAFLLPLLLTASACDAADKSTPAVASTTSASSSSGIVHDAEYYILDAQNGQKWSAEDSELDKKLAELRAKHGRPPNLIHIMWDDTAYGDVGIPAIQKVRGLETPNLNKMAAEGILFPK